MTGQLTLPSEHLASEESRLTLGWMLVRRRVFLGEEVVVQPFDFPHRHDGKQACIDLRKQVVARALVEVEQRDDVRYACRVTHLHLHVSCNVSFALAVLGCKPDVGQVHG